MSDDNIIEFRKSAPSARLKRLDGSDEASQKRARCQHRAVEVWMREPILECKSCGAVVDPYQWIRDRCRDWEDVVAREKYRQEEAKQETEQLKKALRFLRKEFKDEREKYEAERAVAYLPKAMRVKL